MRRTFGSLAENGILGESFGSLAKNAVLDRASREAPQRGDMEDFDILFMEGEFLVAEVAESFRPG